MLAGVEPADDRVDDARSAVDDVERRMEAFLDDLARGERCGILVGDPAGVDRVHVDAIAVVIGRGCARHHVQRGLRHVRVRVPGGLELAVEIGRASCRESV